MAKDINKLGEFILSYEGGFANDPDDSGGATNKGVTLKTLKTIHLDKNKDGVVDIKDLKLLTNNDVIEKVLKPYFWDKVLADKIQDEWVTYYIVDWFWNAGNNAIKRIQRILNLKDDGQLGPKTLEAINSQPPKRFFQFLYNSRIDYYKTIVNKKKSQKKFLNGWLRRANAIKYGVMITNQGKEII